MESFTDASGISLSVESLIGGRSENQDDYGMASTPLGVLVVVCDGMGGGPAGKTASSMARETIMDVVGSADPGANPEHVLKQAVIAANDALMAAENANEALRGMGSTCVCLLVGGDKAYIVHVGDSRCYQLRAGQIAFRTADHSYVAEMVRRGTLTEEQARTSGYSNVITRAIGGAPEVDPETDVVAVRPGDRFALMSDGIWGTMPEPTLVGRLSQATDAATVTEDLTTQVDTLGHDNGGGHDNLTLAVVDIPAKATPASPGFTLTDEGVNMNAPLSTQRTLNDALAEKARKPSRDVAPARGGEATSAAPKAKGPAMKTNAAPTPKARTKETPAYGGRGGDDHRRGPWMLVGVLLTLLVISLCVCFYLWLGRDDDKDKENDKISDVVEFDSRSGSDEHDESDKPFEGSRQESTKTTTREDDDKKEIDNAKAIETIQKAREEENARENQADIDKNLSGAVREISKVMKYGSSKTSDKKEIDRRHHVRQSMLDTVINCLADAHNQADRQGRKDIAQTIKKLHTAVKDNKKKWAATSSGGEPLKESNDAMKKTIEEIEKIRKSI